MKYISFFFLPLLFLCFSCEKDDENAKNGDLKHPNGNVKPLPTNIPDGDFEKWATITSGINSYEEPKSGWWTSLNILSNLGGPKTLKKTTEAHTGHYAAKMSTSVWGDLTIPGILVSGTFDFDAPNMIIEGKPFTEKPKSFRGYYKYFPVSGDSAAIFASITKYMPQNQRRDTIAAASLAILNTYDSYTFFDIDFTYYINYVEPDSINIVFASSADGANFNGAVGSTLYIDDISLIMQNGTEKFVWYEDN